MSRFVFHGRKQPSSRSNRVRWNSLIKSGLKSSTSCTFVLICKKVVVYMVKEHYWSHLFNLCSSFNDKSRLLDPGIGVLLAPPHTENGTKHSLSIQTNSKFKQSTVKAAYIQSSGAPHGLQACTAEQWEGPLHGLWMLFETQSENLGRQVNVPISHVLLYKIIHHPVEEQTAVKHHNSVLTTNKKGIFQSHIKGYQPVDQLLREQICAARLLMVDDQRDGDLQLLFQVFIDLPEGSFTLNSPDKTSRLAS